MLTSDNLQHALLFKRRKEISLYETKLNGIVKEEKKALLINDHLRHTFVQQTKQRRKEWWKSDNKFREMIKRTTDLSYPTRPITSFDTEENRKRKLEIPRRNVITVNDYLEQSIEICEKYNILDGEKSDQINQKISFVRVNSGSSSANLVKHIKEPKSFPKEEINLSKLDRPEMPPRNDQQILKPILNIKKKSKTFVITKEQDREEFCYTFKRFLNNSPFSIENKHSITHNEKLKSQLNDQKDKSKKAISKRDYRFENLINSLNSKT
ncbi:unnamed protein product [Brachionus calyciflorus]|uniref:Uncharacterized protein n=1 Tax=Brachionus calyciflorus TaxID=104777 RepID=A0A814F387_9BILA|nr:unnamed protein product [Brachionus calyciflorus]